MTKSVRLEWDLPTKKDDGTDLDVSEIAHVSIEQSSDGGQTYVEIDKFAASILETVVADLDYGTWFFSATVTNTAGKPGGTVFGSITLRSDAAPGLVTLRISEVA